MTIRWAPREDVVANRLAAKPHGRRSVDVLNRFALPARHRVLWIGLCVLAVAAELGALVPVVLVVPLQVAYLLFLDMEGNLLAVFSDAQVVEAIDDAQGALIGGASLATGLVIAARWRAASGPRRRALLPGIAGIVCLLLFAALVVNDFVTGSRSPVLEGFATGSALLVSLTFLAGLLRSRLARGGLAPLFRELRTTRDGRELTVMVYDASLDEYPELVEAVRAAVTMALENERLQAESRARLDELRASRQRIDAAGDAERRRLERDLHDGAQQRLVGLALQLRLVQAEIRRDPATAEALVATVTDQLAHSLERSMVTSPRGAGTVITVELPCGS